MAKIFKLFLTGCVGMVLAIMLAFMTHRATTVHAESLTPDQALSSLQLPPELQIERFADLRSLGSPRMMTLDQQGHLLVTLVDTGRVVRLDAQGQAEIIAEHLNKPNGIALLGEDLLVAEHDGVRRLPRQGTAWGAPQAFIGNLPAGGHALKSVKVSPDGHIFINVGSSCNVCVEEDPTRATLLRFNADGRPAGALLTLGRHAQSAIWARGLRNSQGMAWHPVTGALYATNEGADNRSALKNGVVNDDLPPEHLNLIEAGKHYGWPYCWGDTTQPDGLFQDPNVSADTGVCSASQAPALLLPAHSTPIGITFLNNSRLPEGWREDAVIALHGSWNRKQPSGYALLRVQFRNQQPVASVPLVTGWLQGQQAWGRPVDVMVGTDGWLYVSDDKTDWIYRIRRH